MEAELKTKYLSILAWPFLFIFGNIWLVLIFLGNLIPHKKIKAGTKFLAMESFKAKVITYYNAPGTFGFKCVIPKDFVLIAKENSRFGIIFECIPENIKEFEEQFIPKRTKNDPKFSGYRIHLKVRDIGKNIKEI